MGKVTLQGKVIIPGAAQGKALVSNEPLSFWGGYNWKTGEIIDRGKWPAHATGLNILL